MYVYVSNSVTNDNDDRYANGMEIFERWSFSLELELQKILLYLIFSWSTAPFNSIFAHLFSN